MYGMNSKKNISTIGATKTDQLTQLSSVLVVLTSSSIFLDEASHVSILKASLNMSPVASDVHLAFLSKNVFGC